MDMILNSFECYFQIVELVDGCHYSMIYVGNQTIAYPFGWRNDKWLHNVLEIPTGEPILDQQAKGCEPTKDNQGCKGEATHKNRKTDSNDDYADVQFWRDHAPQTDYVKEERKKKLAKPSPKKEVSTCSLICSCFLFKNINHLFSLLSYLILAILLER